MENCHMIKKEWFEEYVKSWELSYSWSEDLLSRVCEKLVVLSERNDGTVVPPDALDIKTYTQFVVAKADDALSRHVAPYASALRERLTSPKYIEPAEEDEQSLPESLEYSKWETAVDINYASYKQLEELPVLGKALTSRILQRRQVKGTFQSIDQLTELKGFSEGTLLKLGDRIYASREAPIPSNNAIQHFAFSPSFANYIKLAILDDGKSDADSYVDKINKEIDAAVKDLESVPPSVVGATKAEEAKAYVESLQKLDKLQLFPCKAGAPLFDRDYMDVLLDVVKSVKQRLKVMMFFIRYVQSHRYPTDDVVEALIDAHKKGKDVKVILDRDAEGDVIGSRIINKPIFERLKAEGVPVKFDSTHTITHSKLVVADGEHIIIGSHNWTAGSFHHYDDTSVYLQSTKLAKFYEHRFDDIWNELNP